MISVNVLGKNLSSSDRQIDLNLSQDSYSESSVHQVVKAILAGRRQGTHSTKTRSNVSGGGAKPFKQKGTGRARQGSSRSPLMPGGGIAFGPTPRDYTQKINKKMVLSAIETIILDKVSSGNLVVVEAFELTGKTKEIFNILTEKNCSNAYIVTDIDDDKVLLAGRNVPTVKASFVNGFSVYESVKYEKLIITEKALEVLMKRLVK